MRLIFVLLVMGICLGSGAQTNRVVSPEVRADGRVTFRLAAPKAQEVSFFGDWMAVDAKEAMAREGDVWSVTVGSVKPGIYIYSFTVDGLTIADPVNPQVKLRARTSASLLEVPGNPPEVWEARDVPHGAIEIVPHRATALKNEMRQAWVYKPPGYDKNRREYPVLYLLHGSNDTPAGWTMVGRAHFIMDNLLAEKKAREMIIVMPFGHAVPFDAPREERAKNTATFSEYLFTDLIPLVERQYRVSYGRENRAMVGLSMGGGQALNIGLAHLDFFSALGAFSSGGIPRAGDARFAELLGDAEKVNRKLNILWIGCGRQDGAFAGSQNFSALLKEKGIRHTFREMEGRHTYTVWRECFAEVAPLLFQKRNGK